MADIVIHVRINVDKINKEWLYKGEKGRYLDVAVLYNKEQDDYGSNGPVIQSVPTEVYKKDTSIKGAILGNSKVWDKSGGNESVPGSENKKGKKQDVADSQSSDDGDDLPF